MTYRGQNDTNLGKYEIHNLTFDRIFLYKNKKFKYNRQHLRFFYSSNWPNVFFCKESILHDDSFFSIYAWNSRVFFNIFFHIGRFVFINCIWLVLSFSHIHTKPMFPHANKVCIFLYDKPAGRYVDNMVLFFFHKFDRKNVVRYLFHIKDPWTCHSNNNIWAWRH